MDVSYEFKEIVKNIENKRIEKNKNNYYRSSSSPFIIQASDMLKQLIVIEKKRNEVFPYFISFQRNEKLECDTKQIDQEMTLFAITWTNEVNELKRNYSNDVLITISTQSREHFSAIISYLLMRLQKFTQSLQKLRSLHSRYSISPYKIHSFSSQSRSISNSSPSSKINTTLLNNSQQTSTTSSTSLFSLLSTSSSTSTQSTNTANTTSSLTSQSAFNERYQSEIAPTKKLNQYKEFSLKYEKELLFESKQLQQRHTKELQEVNDMETTINSLHYMMNEFINILQSQEDEVLNIHQTSKNITSSVNETEKELNLTIERSKSYQMTIVSVIIGLSLFLLLLDSLTP